MTDFLSAIAASYDAVAEDYAETFRHELEEQPLERALLGAYAEQVTGPVAEIGCGTGRITRWLADRGVDVSGFDLSAGMLAVARRENPGLRFEQASMLELPVPEATYGGVLAFYSIIHLPTAQLPAVFAEFFRVLRPDGLLLLAFQSGDDVVHGDEWLGHEVDLDLYLREATVVVSLLVAAGFEVQATTERRPEPGEKRERAYVSARRPA